MSKKLISGLLAALMLWTTAAAVNSEQAAHGEQKEVVFQAVLPSGGTEQAEQDALDRSQRVFETLLPLKGYPDAAVKQQGGQLIVTLPADADAQALATEMNAYSGLTVYDADNRLLLEQNDMAKADCGAKEAADGVSAYYIRVALTEKGEKAFAEAVKAAAEQAEEKQYFSVCLDGDEIAKLDLREPPESSSCMIAHGFTEEQAKTLAEQVNAGKLPIAFTVADSAGENENTAPAETEFPDIKGHWAEDALRRGAELGILKGANGKMMPDRAVKRSEAVVILNRILGAAQADDVSGMKNVPENAWYREDLGKGVHIGLLEENDGRYFDTAATRAEAFALIARGFAYDSVLTGEDTLSAFADTASMTAAQKNAAAALISAGVVNGTSSGKLSPAAQLTRAQFVTMLMRMVPAFPAAEDDLSALTGGALIAQDAVLQNHAAAGDRVFAAGAGEAALYAVEMSGRLVLKGAENALLTAGNGTQIGTLAVDPAGTAEVDLSRESAVESLLVAGKGGKVSFAGKADVIGISSTGRTIVLDGVNASSLRITGSDNTIILNGSALSAVIAGGARNNTLTVNGTVGTLTVVGLNSKVDGRGKASEVDIRAAGCAVTLAADAKVENIDPGLSGVKIDFGVPTKVTPGGSLQAMAKCTGVSEEKTCTAQWYQNGKPVGSSINPFIVTEGAYARRTTTFTFTKDMPESVTLGFKLTYENPSTGQTEELYDEVTVPIENYSAEWYYQRDVDRVLKLVSCDYRGNYTASYAVNGDYQPYEKETWINAKGYSSSTQYLCWINRAYQHVNVFKGSKGNWKLVKSFLVGTGAMSTPTPVGVTTVSYKSAGGWTTGTYTVRPVVGFYPGTGYAFHSRLCYPGTDTEYDFSSGYPVSHGCVRMLKPDVKWIYDNIPVGSTVVIY